MKNSAHPRPHGPIRGLLQSIGHARQGLVFALRSQRNFRIHVVVAILVLGAGFSMKLPSSEMAILMLTCSMVILGELLNTALEVAMNLLEMRHHPVVRMAKDIAAGGVLIAVIGSVLVGFFIFGPHLWAAR